MQQAPQHKNAPESIEREQQPLDQQKTHLLNTDQAETTSEKENKARTSEDQDVKRKSIEEEKTHLLDKSPLLERPQVYWYKRRTSIIAICCALVAITALVTLPLWQTLLQGSAPKPPTTTQAHATPTAQPTPIPFDPNVGAVLPNHRVVAFYAVPGAEVTGPAYVPSTSMLNDLKKQGAEYERLDPAHPVQLGIDLVVSVPDSYPGPDNTYSHHVDIETMKAYLAFCARYNLLLFLDLNIGQAPVMQEVNSFLPYLEKYPFVHLAIDPEWMFPRHDGIPGTNLSNVRASDLNPIIDAVAALPARYHIPRKMLIIHQYRGDGDGLSNPYNAGQAEIADKRNIHSSPNVDVVFHVDSVGGFPGDKEAKRSQYAEWVGQDIQNYHNFRYGGFKIFYKIEAKTGIMTPKEVLSLNPAPLIITYGN
ncbi:hypothetical protein [Ktedonospora formicarum]|uniref:Uncharacterized protein n=1 Tax=Ktedonospora formicarum TaxID=2778364 RepID=A0A8J3MVS7_9CHLR|nr:hypothetical protein [Ktedonospora formicarum]GHO46820.1 hypothetical protein KSX_49830 [Ktedonospora formicarum]